MSVTETFNDMRHRRFSTNHQPIGWSLAALFIGMVVALATEFQKLDAWTDLKQIHHVMHGLQIAGGVAIPFVAQFLRK